MKKVFIILGAIIILTSCNEIPENVIAKGKQYYNAEEHKGIISYIPYEEMKDDIDIALKKKYSNFTLRNGISIQLPDKLIECDFIQTKDFL